MRQLRRKACPRWRLARLIALLALLAAGLRPAPAAAQAPVQVVLDAPADSSTIGAEVTVRGWASAASDAAGVDAVAVYVDGEGDDRGRFLGTASYGLPRPDVATALGDPRLENVGYELRVSLPPGDHRLAVYAHASDAPESGGWSAPAAVTVTVTSAAAGTPAAASRAAPRPAPAAPPGVTGASVCTNRAPSGACLAYSAANGGIAMVCSEQSAQGDCTAWTQSYTVTTACAQYGEGGQCLVFGTSPAANPPPGGAAQTTALCLEYNAVGQCNRYAGQPVADPTTIRLTAQMSGTAISLTWSALPAAVSYEVLRCPTAQLGNCSTVAQAGATSFALPTRQNYWYAVRARGADGQVLATSNFLGPL
ncbi:MAG TPA: hypothetical protein VK066_17695 [Chloroflexota bacterium]|nr:hypothetical protein [Chloroflexota bacterium]